MRPASPERFGAEAILALISTGWFVLLAFHQPTPAASPVISNVTGATGGNGPFIVFIGILAALQWAALMVEPWPPRVRSVVILATSLWWVFISVVTALVRLGTPLWPTTAGLAALAFRLWLDMRTEVVRVTWKNAHQDQGGGDDG